MTTRRSVSVVTPTLGRPAEVGELLANLAKQTWLPSEVIIVDGASPGVDETRRVVERSTDGLPFPVHYLRAPKGTAVQRNIGIDVAIGDFVAFVDDDVRLDADFIAAIGEVFADPSNSDVGGVVGYRRNMHFKAESTPRWRWYKRLDLLTTFEPGRYDRSAGYPVNVGLQPPFVGTRPVDFMTTACAVWRREVFDASARFDPWFTDYGVLEDAHFSLRAARHWRLVQCGDATAIELHSSSGRIDPMRVGYKSVVNYHYVFRSVEGPLSREQSARFWRYQIFELLRVGSSALRRGRWSDARELIGRLQGFAAVARGATRTAELS